MNALPQVDNHTSTSHLLDEYRNAADLLDKQKVEFYLSFKGGVSNIELEDQAREVLTRAEQTCFKARISFESTAGIPATRGIKAFTTDKEIAENALINAVDDYYRSLDVLIAAKTPLAESAARRLYEKSANAARIADSAFQSLSESVNVEPEKKTAKKTAVKSSNIDFSMIREVVELSRRMANDDFQLHLSAYSAAKPDDEKACLESLVGSVKSLRLADGAYKSLISAESDFRSTTVSLLQGDQAAATQQARSSGDNLTAVADKLDRFSVVAPQSRFFGKVLSAAVIVDQLAGKLETNVIVTAEHFTDGLKAFAHRVANFGAAVAQFPSKVAQTVKATSVSLKESVALIGSRFMSSMRDLLVKTEDKLGTAIISTLDAVDKVDRKMTSTIENSIDKSKASAFSFLQESSELAARIKNRVENVAETVATRGVEVVDSVSRHVSAVAGIGAIAADAATKKVTAAASLSGGIFSQVVKEVVAAGHTVVDKYVEQLDKVDLARETQRKSHRP